MSRPELLTPSLLRMDGRRPYEFRSLEIHFAPDEIRGSNAAAGPSTSSSSASSTFPPSAGPASSDKADGCVRLVQGLNDVTCSVFGPRDAQLSGNRTGGGGGGAGGQAGVGPEGAALDVEVLAENWSSVGAERRAGGRGDR